MRGSIVTIETDAGPREVRAVVLDDNETFAVHETTGLHMMRPWTLSHLPSGRGVVLVASREDAVKIGRHLLRVARNGEWSSWDPANVEAAVPQEVQLWLKDCWDKNAFVPPGPTAAQPQEKKMPKQKTFKAGPIANRIVRDIVQSMTPENRKSFHEGLRVVARESIAGALSDAFEAGKGGCLFSKE